MRTFRMKYVCWALVFVAAFAGRAVAQKVKDFVEVEGARTNYLVGEGLVIGLNGNGDSPKGLTAQRLRNFLTQHAGWNVRESDLNSKNIALVVITAELPPFQAEGTRIDVQVNAIGDAKSLAGGKLLSTPLRSPAVRAEDPTIYALAQGQLVLEGDPKTGNQTSASVPKGAMIENPIQHQFVREDGKGNQYIVLNLNKTDFSLAHTIAKSINQSDRIDEDLVQSLAEKGLQLNIAQAVDGGTVVVRIPGESKENFTANPVKFVSRILTDVDIQLVDPEKAMVILNDKTKTITTTGSIRVKSGSVRVKTTVVTIPPEMREMTMQDLLLKYETKLQPQDMIDVIKELDRAGLIKGLVISR